MSSAMHKVKAILLSAPLVWLALVFAGVKGLGLPLWQVPADEGRRIEVSSSFVHGLAWLHSERTGQVADEAQRQALAHNYAEEEVLFREARALGLDEGDTIIRRRMVQKMRFLVEDAIPVAEPTEQDLLQVLAQHPGRFEAESAARFTQVILPSQRSEAEVQAVLAQARAGRPEAAAALGISLATAPAEGLLPRALIERRYGVKVAEAAVQGPLQTWQGPVLGPHGWHLVYVYQQAAPPAPDLADPRVARRARALWMTAERERNNREAMRRLMAQYEVVLPGPSLPAEARAEAHAEVRP